MANDEPLESRKLALEERKEQNARQLRERELDIEAQKASIDHVNAQDDKRARIRVAMISILSAVVGAATSIGTAYLTGNLNVQGKHIDNAAEASLEQQKFSYQLISTALNEEDDNVRAQRLRFMVEVGLLDNLNVKKLIEYADLEEDRIEKGDQTPSFIPRTNELAFDSSDRAPLLPGYAVRLIDAGPSTINLIKEIRAATGLGLKESKIITERPGELIVTGLAPEAANRLVSRFQAIGATVEIELIEITK